MFGRPSRLPDEFALVVDSHMGYVYILKKIIYEERETYDVSALRSTSYDLPGDIFLQDSFPPLFSVERFSMNRANNYNSIHKFCITPLYFRTHNDRFPVVIIEDFHYIQRAIPGVHPVSIGSFFPRGQANRAKDLIRFLFQQFDSYSEETPHLRPERRWPNGLIYYPTDANFDFMRHPYRYWIDSDYADDEEEPTLQRRPPTPPRPTSTQSAPSAPSAPSERVAGALARDSVNQKEICPITQEALKATKIAVTGCLCVFQGEALESYKGTTCPSCRTPLTVRYILLEKTNEVSINSSGASTGTQGNSQSN